MNNTIFIQTTLDELDSTAGALHSLSHLIEIIDNTADNISYLHLANLLSLMADGVQYRLTNTKQALSN